MPSSLRELRRELDAVLSSSTIALPLSPEQLARGAYVYVRRSTADQVRHNHESRRRRFALADRTRTLAWTEVLVINDDVGFAAGVSSGPLAP